MMHTSEFLLWVGRSVLARVDAVPPLLALAFVIASAGGYQLCRVGLEKVLYGEPIGRRAFLGGCVFSVGAMIGELAFA